VQPIIVVQDLVKTYGNLRAVNGTSFEVHENEVFGIVGPNGAGKTTMVECIVGLRVPDGGSISILGLNPKTDGYKLRQLIGIQLQEGKFPDRIKTREVMEVFSSLYARSLPVKPVLEQVGLLDKADSYFDNLSGGQKQRLAIALSLLSDPPLVFFDELTTGLDPQARRAMWGLVKDIRDTGKTIVLVTHFMEEAERLCDRVAIMDHGRIVALDTPANLVGSIGGGLAVSFLADDVGLVAQLQSMAQCKVVAANQEVFIQCADYRVVGEVIRFLGDSGCDFDNFTITKPTLEDAFLAITGRVLRE